MVALGVQNFLWFILLWAMIIFYTSAGGFKAVVSTDVIQASFFIVIFIGAFAYSILFADQPVSIPFEINMVGEGAVSSGKLFGWLFMPLLFMIIEQDMGQRCFAAESGSTVSKATFFAGICTILICSIPVFFGVLARNLNLSIPEGASVLMTAIQTTTSPIVAALVGAAVLAAIISTADSLINAISSNISQDFDIKLIKSKTILSSQMLTALVASVGVAFSFYFSNIVDLLIQSYELSISCLFVPILFALLGIRNSARVAAVSMIGGALGFVLFRFVETALPRELLSIVLSFAAYAIGHLLLNSQKSQIEERG